LDNFQGQPIISRMNRIIFLVFSIIFLICSRGAYSQQMSFDKTVLVGKEIDPYNSRVIQVNRKGDVYVAAYYKGLSTIGTSQLNTNSTSNYAYSKGLLLAKYNSAGQFIWAMKVAECDTFKAFNFEIDETDHLYFSFGYNGTLYYLNDSIKSKGDSDILILKLDSLKNLLFTIPIGGSNGEGFYYSCLKISEKNEIVLGGYYNYTWTNISPGYKLPIGNDTLASNDMDIFLVKFDSIGNSIMTMSMRGLSGDFVSSICLDKENIYVNATFYNSPPTILIDSNQIYLPVNYISTSLIIKLDDNGNLKWTRYFGSTINNNLGGYGIKVSNSRVYIEGHGFSNSQNKFDFQNGPSLIGPFGRQYYIACYDTSGNFIWNTISKGSGSSIITSLTTDSNANVYAAGVLESTLQFPTDTFYSHGGYDIFVCSYDSVGNFRWATRGGGAGVDICSDITTSPEGKLYVVGGTTSIPCYMGRDTIYPPSNQSTLFYASMDSVIIPAPDGIQPIDNSKKSFTLYPNPTSGHFLLQTDAKHIRQINVYSVLGERVFTMTNPSQQASIPIQLPPLPDGLYILKASNDEGNFTQSFLVQTH
jgi:hypothetical protein